MFTLIRILIVLPKRLWHLAKAYRALRQYENFSRARPSPGKRIIPVLLLLLLCAPARGQIHARYNLTDFTLAPQSVKRLTITPLLAYTVTSTNIVTGDRLVRILDGGGSTTVSNMTPGRYRVEFSGASVVTIFTNNFAATLSGLVNAAAFIETTNLAGSGLALLGDVNGAAFSVTNLATLGLRGGNGTNFLVFVTGDGTIHFSNTVTGAELAMLENGDIFVGALFFNEPLGVSAEGTLVGLSDTTLNLGSANGLTYGGAGVGLVSQAGFTGDGSRLTSIAPAALNWSAAVAVGTVTNALKVPVLTNAGKIYWLVLSTNSP